MRATPVKAATLMWLLVGCASSSDGPPLTVGTGGSPAAEEGGSIGASSGGTTGGTGGTTSSNTGGSVAGRSGAGGDRRTGGTTGGSAGTGGMKGAGGSPAVDAGPVDPGSGPFAQYRQACVDKINAFRATEGKAPYERWADSEACADGEAKSDSETKKAHGAFGQCGESAQNECPNWGSDVEKIITGCLQSMWNEGPGEPFSAHGHYINMSSTKYKRVSCGFYLTADGKLWAVQNFK